MGKHGDIKLEVMRIFLNQDEDISVRGIARQLDLPSSHIHYHLKKMVEIVPSTDTLKVTSLTGSVMPENFWRP